MKPMFNKDDIGKKVLLELDVDKDPVAKALGASKVTLSGTIVEAGETSIKIKAHLPNFWGHNNPNADILQKMDYATYGSSRKRTEKIDYDMIKSYKFY